MQPSNSNRRGRNAAENQTQQPPSASPAQSSADRQEGSRDASNEEIARRAYSRWEQSDRSHGRDQEHWFAAEEELRGGSRRDPSRTGSESEADEAEGRAL